MAPKMLILKQLYNQGLAIHKICYLNKSVNDAQKQFSVKWREALKGVAKCQNVNMASDFVREWTTEKSQV